MHRGIFILIIARGKRAHYGAHSIFACIISNTIITICDTRQPEERERERERESVMFLFFFSIFADQRNLQACSMLP